VLSAEISAIPRQRALVVRSRRLHSRGMRGSVGDSYRRESMRKTTVRETNGYRHSICIRTDGRPFSGCWCRRNRRTVSSDAHSACSIAATARLRTSPAHRGITHLPVTPGGVINDFFVCNSGRCSASLDVRDCREVLRLPETRRIPESRIRGVYEELLVRTPSSSRRRRCGTPGLPTPRRRGLAVFGRVLVRVKL